MAKPRTFYGWEADGKFYLSASINHAPRNEYTSKAEAEAEAKKRRALIEWQDG